MAEVGKQIGTRQYVGKHQVDALPDDAKELVARGEALLPRADLLGDVNVLRVDPKRLEVAFLAYPDLGRMPFPSLRSSWRVDVSARLVNNRRYDGSLNPPILHRTELLLPPDHPAKPLCEALTKDCEQLGLFSDPTRIGFQHQWEELIRSRGYQIDGFSLAPIGNTDVCESPVDLEQTTSDIAVWRHLTALSRTTLSAPVQKLISDELLTQETTFFDYGCGRGDDLAALESNGFHVLGGWDPHFRPDSALSSADVVNLGFVINVIEDRTERCKALEGAFSLARRLLAVSAMLGSNDASKGREYRDGVLTSRKTFQKYFSQNELRQFIESVLDLEAYPAAPGVFYVFRDQELEQRYLLGRTNNRARTREVMLRFPRRPARSEVRVETEPDTSRPRVKTERPLSEDVTKQLDALWQSAVELGRVPDQEEISDSSALVTHFRTLKRAWQYCLEHHDAQALGIAARGRREDILVMLALRTFDQRRRFGGLEPRLARDIKFFFGKLSVAESEATKLLFSLQDTTVIEAACEAAATSGLGWLEPGESLQLHSSLINRLPAALRVYIGCAAIMAGDLRGYDLIKAHIRSGKVSLLAYDDFDGKPFPLLQRRVKVRLRDQQLDIFEYGEEHPPTVLFRKSRYINEEFPYFAQQIQIEEQLEELALFDLNAYGPPQNVFADRLASRRYRVAGYALERSTDVPDIDAACGSSYRFRDLIECGETWRKHRVENVPAAPETYNALSDLCIFVLDPVIDYFGAIELTYCFASSSLTKHIAHGIAPELDQHASCESTRRGNRICSRGGAAVDFLVRDEDMHEVARWIAKHCLFDRMYLYGRDRPIHVSVGPENSRSIVYLEERNGRRVPRSVDIDSL